MNNKILVVDDNKGVRRELVFLLEDEGYLAFQAENGIEALDLLNKHNPEIVITDILMPDMDGLELSQVIRKKYPETKIIAISGGGRVYVQSRQSTNDLLRQVNKIIKPDAIFKKPFENNLLMEKIEDLINN